MTFRALSELSLVVRVLIFVDPSLNNEVFAGRARQIPRYRYWYACVTGGFHTPAEPLPGQPDGCLTRPSPADCRVHQQAGVGWDLPVIQFPGELEVPLSSVPLREPVREVQMASLCGGVRGLAPAARLLRQPASHLQNLWAIPALSGLEPGPPRQALSNVDT